MSPAVAVVVDVAAVAAAVAAVEQHPIKWHKMLTGNGKVGNGKCGNGGCWLMAQATGIMPPIKLMISQNIRGGSMRQPEYPVGYKVCELKIWYIIGRNSK